MSGHIDHIDGDPRNNNPDNLRIQYNDGDPRWTLTVEHIGSLVWKWELEGGGIEVVGTSFTRNGAVRGAKRWLAKDARRSRSRRVYDWDGGFRL